MKLRVIIENISDEYGGPANSLPLLLATVQRELGINSVIYSTISSSNEKNELIERFSIPWIRCKGSGLNKLKYSKQLKSKLMTNLSNDDVLFSNNLWNYPAFLSDQLSKAHKIPHIISVRGSLYPWSLNQGKLQKNIAWRLFQKKALQRAALVHVTCSDEYKAVRELGITSPIAIIRHGINYDDYQNLPDKSEAIEHLGLNKNKKYILFMSRLHKKKGLDLLLKTWPSLVKKNPHWCLLIVGPDYSNYTNFIKKLALKHDILNNLKVFGMLTGHEKKCAFSSSEFFVLPSHTENFGVVIGEALAAGLPAITTTGTPWAQINTHKCGKYIDLSQDNLHQALKEMMLLESDELAVMAKNAKLLIKNNYSWSTQASKFGQALSFIKNGNIAPNVVYQQNDTPPTSNA